MQPITTVVGRLPTGTLYQLGSDGHHFTGHWLWSTSPHSPFGPQKRVCVYTSSGTPSISKHVVFA